MEVILSRIATGDSVALEMKKLGGFENRYRIRKGNVRIQFSLDEKHEAVDIEIGWRDDTTYHP